MNNSNLNVKNKKISIITQLRSGTHYLQYALMTSLCCKIFQATRTGDYIELSKDYLKRGLYNEDNLNQTLNMTADTEVYFSHYYHCDNLEKIQGIPTIYVIGFPLDSFYSDALAYSSESFDPRPSIYRDHYLNYKFKKNSNEWRFLEKCMVKNSEWLDTLIKQNILTVLRYEDFFNRFIYNFDTIQTLTGPFAKLPPFPKKNSERTYWNDNYLQKFDIDALKKLCEYFYKSIEKFYPEKINALNKVI